MATPGAGTGECLKIMIRYLASHPRGLVVFSRGQVGEALCVWTDSECVGKVPTRSTCSGSYIQRNGGTACHWRKAQSNVALSSGAPAALHSALEDVSEVVGALAALWELFSEYQGVMLSVDAGACKGILLRICIGKGEHTSVPSNSVGNNPGLWRGSAEHASRLNCL